MSLTLASDEVKVLLDSLPYVDTEYDDPAMQSQVRALIEAEMGSMQPRDYLAHLPKPSEMDFPDNPVLASEVRRMVAGQPMPPLDVSRYEVPAPAKELLRDPSAWRASVSNARAQLEQQHNRLANLELLQQYGPQAWLQQNGALASMKEGVSTEATGAAKAAEEANLKRKLTQEQAAPRLAQLRHSYSKGVDENQQLALAVELLKEDVKRLRGEAVAHGLTPSDEELAKAAAEAKARATGTGVGGGTTAADVDLFAGEEVTGMED